MNSFEIICHNIGYTAIHNKTHQCFRFANKEQLCEFLDFYYHNPVLAEFAYRVKESMEA